MTKMNAAYLKERLNLILKEIARTAAHRYHLSTSDEEVIKRYFTVVLPVRRTGRPDLPENNLDATFVLMKEYLKQEIP